MGKFKLALTKDLPFAESWLGAEGAATYTVLHAWFQLSPRWLKAMKSTATSNSRFQIDGELEQLKRKASLFLTASATLEAPNHNRVAEHFLQAL